MKSAYIYTFRETSTLHINDKFRNHSMIQAFESLSVAINHFSFMRNRWSICIFHVTVDYRARYWVHCYFWRVLSLISEPLVYSSWSRLVQVPAADGNIINDTCNPSKYRLFKTISYLCLFQVLCMILYCEWKRAFFL